MTEVLDCSNCELAAGTGAMCGVVASRTVREMVKIGYDLPSDARVANETVKQQVSSNPDINAIAASECNFRLMQQESMRQGYGTVTY